MPAWDGRRGGGAAGARGGTLRGGPVPGGEGRRRVPRPVSRAGARPGAPVSWPLVEQRALGRSGLVVSRLALGTMTWGRDTDEDDAAEQVKTFQDAGGTLIDTADVYADGEAEAVLGGVLHPLGPRARGGHPPQGGLGARPP